jgi:hypothetical protein
MLGIRIRNMIWRVRMFLSFTDTDPLLKGADPAPAPNPSLFSEMCWAVWNNAWKIKFLTQNLIKKLTFLDRRWCAYYKKKYEKKYFSFASLNNQWKKESDPYQNDTDPPHCPWYHTKKNRKKPKNRFVSVFVPCNYKFWSKNDHKLIKLTQSYRR